ncbi:hypothetical protein L1D34_07170 [Vibrio mediterranei]|uniref:hypothetical protein n=1 Tax=Vibrio mediterranei TaxID=689 RepID=UPI001EFD2D61|nr:hypothetical protein [Vibrio mediterranei]MCG9624619.1 hypothetical protein [Vibrio mediterranei]
MSNKESKQPSAPLSIGGVSSLLILAANIFVPEGHTALVTTGAPILVAFIFKAWSYCTASQPSETEIATSAAIDRQIQFLKDSLAAAKAEKRDADSIKALDAELLKQELARAAIPDLITKGKK